MGSWLRPLAFVSVVLCAPAIAWAHGGGPYRGPPGEVPPPARTQPLPPRAPPGDPCHRCQGLRGLAGEVAPDGAPRGDPPPPPASAPEEGVALMRVQTPDGKPPVGAWIWRGGRPVAMTSSQGVVRVPAGRAGAIYVVTAAGWQPVIVPVPVEDEPLPVVTLRPSAPLRVRVAADPALLGRVRFRLVPDADRVPEDFAIAAEASGWNPVRVGVPDGALRLRFVPPGRYRLRASAPGVAERTVAWALETGTPETHVVRLPAEFAPTEFRARVRLVTPEGEPVDGAGVEVSSADGRRECASVRDGVAEVVVTGYAPFAVRASSIGGCTGPLPMAACAHGLPAGDHELTLSIPAAVATSELVLAGLPEGEQGIFVRVVDVTRDAPVETYWLGPSDLRVPTFDDARLRVVWARSAGFRKASVGGVLHGVAAGSSVALPPASPATGVLTGRIVRADGTAVAGAQVRARGAYDTADSDLVLTADADADGRFAIAGIEGDVLVTAAAPGLDNRESPTSASPGDDVTVVVEEERVARRRGRTTDR